MPEPTITIHNKTFENWINKWTYTPTAKPKPLTPKTQHKNKTPANPSSIKIKDLYKYTPLSPYTGIEGTIPIRAGTTYVGCEIELENVNIKTLAKTTWKQTEDGSLKEQGVEFVTIPIQAKYLEIELHQLFNSLKTFKTSSRCSVHIHLNVRNISLEELINILILYMIFEKSLYRFSGNRWNNNFCTPLHFYPEMIFNTINILKTYNTFVHNTWHKYCGLNIIPIYGDTTEGSKKYGTIEFRHLEGTTNITWIINWINLIISLKITAKKFKTEELLHKIKTMNTTSEYYWLCKETFKNFSHLIEEQPNFKNDVENCISLVKEIFIPKTKEIFTIPLL